MKRKKEITELLFDIKKEIPYFNKEELIEYTKYAIPNIYNILKNEETQEIKIKCDKKLIEKMLQNKTKYRISKYMDHLSVQYIDLFDYIKKDNEILIQIYVSIYFYDDARNNKGSKYNEDKYWNDGWIVTYRNKVKYTNYNCTNCGAIMEYNKTEDIFECKYCGNKSYNQFNTSWEIVDIEIEK